MVDVTSTTQLSLFALVKAELLSNTTISGKFRDASFDRFEPSFKSFSFPTLPLIIIETPGTDSEFLVLDHSNNMKAFNANIILLIDFTARDKFDEYANAIIFQLESAEATFESSGYFNLEIDLVDAGEDIVQDRKIVRGTFELRLSGSVSR